jgi:hypothetical protein
MTHYHPLPRAQVEEGRRRWGIASRAHLFSPVRFGGLGTRGLLRTVLAGGG